MPVRIAVQIHPQHLEYDQIRKTVGRVEELGVDIVYNWDHFFPLYGNRDGLHFECWTMLGGWAEQTSTIEIGALVTCNSYRNPQLLADMARTVDHIAGGRLILGIGAGWFRRDYDEYGYEFGTVGSRGRDLQKALPLIKERLTRLEPPPTRPLPILIGGSGEKVTLRITAEHADAWHSFPRDPAWFEHKSGVLDRWCNEVGRDPSEIERSVGMGDLKKDQKLADAYYELGARQITLDVSGPRLDLGPVEPWLAWRDQKNGV